MSKSTIITIVALVLILIFVGAITLVLRGGGNVADGDAARTLISTPDSPYTDLEGNPVTFDTYEGKVRVVNSWASWCPFCAGELPDLGKLASEYKNKDVIIIAINRKESNIKAKSFLESFDDLSSINFIQDSTDSFYKSIGGFSMPETVFYDKEGNISTHKRGFMSLDEMITLTEKALNETKGE